MKLCPYCNFANDDGATLCRKCEGPFVAQQQYVAAKAYLVGPEKSRLLRGRALSAIVLGLLIAVYWGEYGPWPVVDHPALASLRTWLQPLLLYGGGFLYALGWVLRYI
ncbi:MAG: hypothetical protein HYS33_00195 [Acidobacteria bacterium]|nr:hypothetical protein [Acidobacteriota bacterium]